jgi:hypothetical protein
MICRKYLIFTLSSKDLAIRRAPSSASVLIARLRDLLFYGEELLFQIGSTQ